MPTLEEEIIRKFHNIEAISRRGQKDAPPPGGNDQPSHRGRGRMLGVLNDNGAMSQSQLASILDIRPQSLSELLVKAEADGFISREQSEDDRRTTIVSITDEGRARVSAFREKHRKEAADFLAPLSAEEKSTLSELLGRIISAREEK